MIFFLLKLLIRSEKERTPFSFSFCVSFEEKFVKNFLRSGQAFLYKFCFLGYLAVIGGM